MDTIFPLVTRVEIYDWIKVLTAMALFRSVVLFFYRAWTNRRRANSNVAHPYACNNEDTMYVTP